MWKCVLNRSFSQLVALKDINTPLFIRAIIKETPAPSLKRENLLWFPRKRSKDYPWKQSKERIVFINLSVELPWAPARSLGLNVRFPFHYCLLIFFCFIFVFIPLLLFIIYLPIFFLPSEQLCFVLCLFSDIMPVTGEEICLSRLEKN